jgi:hypothetical protein
MSIADVDPSGMGSAVVEQKRPPVGDSRFAFWWRTAVLAGLFFGAYGAVFAQVLNDAVSGSRTAFLVVAPLLVMVGATGYRLPARGVGDNESDWIVAVVTGVVGFSSIALITHRFPTLSGLWRLELVGALIWVACAGMIVFSTRHVLRMWQVWIFAFVCALTLPYLLTTASLGGSDTAAAAVGALLAAVSVYLAGRPTRRRWRIAATLLCLAISSVLSVLLIAHLGLFLTLIVVAAVVPVVVTVGLHHFTEMTSNHRWAAVSAGFHPLSPRSIVVLGLVAVGVLVTHIPAPSPPAPPLVNGDWAVRSGLGAPTEFGFVTRFLGPQSSLVRFEVPAAVNSPAAAVDVITTPNLAALRDYSDAVWYPSPIPVNFQPMSTASHGQFPVDARMMHSNADAATDATAQNWYAITWVWKTAAAYQQVTVVVNQSAMSPDSPVVPAPLSVADTVMKPILWVARQQPEWVGGVDKRVEKRADDIVRSLVAAAQPPTASTAEPTRG